MISHRSYLVRMFFIRFLFCVDLGIRQVPDSGFDPSTDSGVGGLIKCGV